MRFALAISGIAIALVACAGPDNAQTPTSPNPSSPQGQPATQAVPRFAGAVATGLEVPWGVGFLPDGTAIVTERDTKEVIAIRDGRTVTVGRVNEAVPQGEGGLLGVAVSPTFASDSLLYFYYTTANDNRVARTTYRNGTLGAMNPILTGIPAGFIHNGGRMTFGPDKFLYVATGDAGEQSNAANMSSLAGKILRITTKGKPAPGNPVANSAVWSLGHRNVQGLAFDPEGHLWASEFGQDKADELNLIRKGGNYGWPEVEGTGTDADYINPAMTWPTDANSPSGLAYANGFLWMGSLKGERLWRVSIAGTKATASSSFFAGQHGRLRTVVAAPNSQLWVTTSNRDGRGQPKSSDDQILSFSLN